jgi:enoyl-CoA hydratase
MENVQYEVIDQVAVITLDRGHKANAQTPAMLDELDACWRKAGADPGVNVVLLRANGAHFSAGMDLSAPGSAVAEAAPARNGSYYNPVSVHYFANTMGWRNLPKPSIAAVQGKCVAAGLMLCWPCDLIIAADNAEFSDPTTRMGLAGIEYMAHIWEMGPRKAKELLLRSTALTAEEARDLGMVNRVVPLARLHDEAMSWARDIAGLEPAMAALVKRAINGMLDTQGYAASLAHAFDLQELAAALQSQGRPDRGRGSLSVLEHMRRTNADIAEREAGGPEAGGPDSVERSAAGTA